MSAVCTYDFTCFSENVEDTKKLLKCYAKSWDFQQEASPTTGKLHFQGRLSLKVRERPSTLIKKFPGWHFSITSNENTDNNYYVTKEDTRIAGPWSSNDIEKYIPRQIREIQILKPWQQKIVESAKVWDTRTINVIVDKVGNNGKSVISAYCRAHNIGRKLPYCNDFKDMMRMVMDLPESSMYIIDIPRALKKDQLFQFYAAIEEIKNGYAFDDRYKFREKDFDCPTVWVFTNVDPDLSLLSSDRWKIFDIKENDLVYRGFPERDAILGANAVILEIAI